MKSKPISFSDRTGRLTPPPINWLIEYQLAHPEVISLAAGLVDYASLPGGAVAKLSSELLTPEGTRRYLQYGTTQGNPELRQEICRLFESQEKPMSAENPGYSPRPEHCVVGAGSQQLLMLLADTLFNPGDIVLVEAPTYLVFMGVLENCGVRCIPVEMDAHGLNPDSLRRKINRLKDSGLLPSLKCLYTVDYFQNPSNISLSEERKPQILEIVRQIETDHQVIIIEDAAYRDIAFSPAPSHSVKSFDVDNNMVAYTSTFSKPFSPGLKTGYALLPQPILEKVVQHKGNHDFGSSHFNQGLLLRALQTGEYARHRRTLQELYRKKATLMYDTLRNLLPSTITFNMPAGGMYFWLNFPTEIYTGRDTPLFNACLEEKVLYVPGEYCFAPDSLAKAPQHAGAHQMRLSYGTADISELASGVERLARAVKRVMPL